MRLLTCTYCGHVRKTNGMVPPGESCPVKHCIGYLR